MAGSGDRSEIQEHDPGGRDRFGIPLMDRDVAARTRHAPDCRRMRTHWSHEPFPIP
jgi:hypothetical protein